MQQSGPTGRAVTAQGHPRRIFATAIERGNIVMAEAIARELGRISLEEALAMTALVAEKEPERRSRFAVRWLRRLLEEDESLTIEGDDGGVLSLTLGGPSSCSDLESLHRSPLSQCRGYRGKRVEAGGRDSRRARLEGRLHTLKPSGR
jgi:hypothetical protein